MRIFLLKSQRGVALITVLFMFSLVAVVLSALIVLNSSDINRATNYFSSEQAYLLCLSGEEVARQILVEDFKKNQNIDHINEDWAKSGYTFELNGGYFEFYIEDAMGKFNINNLSAIDSGMHKVIFSNMLHVVLDEKSLAEKIAGQLADWVDVDNTVGVEEFDYLSEKPSYRPPNGPVADISEIRWLKDIDSETYKIIHDELFSSLVAIPTQNKININTITPHTLAGLANINIKIAEEIVKNIRSKDDGFTVPAQAVVGIPGIDLSLLDVKSDYFLVRIRAKYGQNYAYLSSLIFRDRAQNGRLEILSRSRSDRFIFPFSKDYNESVESGDYEIDI